MLQRGLLNIDLNSTIHKQIKFTLNKDLVSCLGMSLAKSEQFIINCNQNSINHSFFSGHYLHSQSNNKGYYLIQEIWKPIKLWAKTILKIEIDDNCPVSFVSNIESNPNALGVFEYNSEGYYRIVIHEKITSDTNIFLIVLVHEIMHYLHYKSVNYEHFYSCPIVLAEGFAEFATTKFLLESTYKLPIELQKSWNPSYELGRMIINQIHNENYELYLIMHGFLGNTTANNRWSLLDHLFAS